MHGTLFVSGNSGLHRLHPLTKLALTFLFLVFAATLPNLLWLLAAFVILLVPMSAWGGLLRPFLRSCLVVITPFVISLSIIQGFFTPGETPLFHLAGFVLTGEGLLAGLTVASRILMALGGALLLMLSTRPDMLMLALTRSGLPGSLAYVVLTSIQIFPRFQERAQVILEAQQARGLEIKVNIFKRLRLLVPLMGPLVLSSIVDVEERAMALEARAFSRPGRKTSLLALADSPGQHLARWGLLLLMLALIGWSIWRAISS
ncbi:MAG: energy-coupling factor transporter transmembrane protein EcfT [Chloroflexi bacterium]|nr:energy-coupling factor transporter transmembrane protein EcfT [Chloroflexota bacterium]